MIAKTGTGKSFKGLASYLQDEMKNGTILDSDGVRTTTPQAMAYDFHQQAKFNERTTKSVGHDSLSFSLQDKKMSDQEMKEIAKDYMAKMDYKDTQFAIIRHNDRPHQHCHIVYNRINNQGQTISDKHNFYKANKVCREIEKKYGLEIVDGNSKVKEKTEQNEHPIKTKIHRHSKDISKKESQYSLNEKNSSTEQKNHLNSYKMTDKEKIEAFSFKDDDSLDLKREYLKAETDEQKLEIILKSEEIRAEKQREEENQLDNNLRL